MIYNYLRTGASLGHELSHELTRAITPTTNQLGPSNWHTIYFDSSRWYTNWYGYYYTADSIDTRTTWPNFSDTRLHEPCAPGHTSYLGQSRNALPGKPPARTRCPAAFLSSKPTPSQGWPDPEVEAGPGQM